MTRAAVLSRIALAAWLLAGPALGDEAPSGGDESARIELFRASERDFSRGLASQQRREWASALEHYRSALEGDPDFVEAMANAARVHVELEEYAAADELLDRAQALRPDYPASYGVRGLLLLRQGNVERAIEELGTARELAPYDVEILTNLGVALTRRGHLAEARQVLEDALRLAPDDEDVVFDLALADDLAGDTMHAAFRYRRFLELAATDDPARGRVAARLRRIAGEPPAAEPESRAVGLGIGPPPISNEAEETRNE